MNAELENKVEYKYYQIVLAEQYQADNVYKELKASRKPLKFSDGARKYSIDAQTSGNGGEVDFKPEASIQKPIIEILKNLKKDEFSKPFQVGTQWYIVKSGDLKKSKPMEFESTKEYIRHLIKIDEIEKINGRFIKDKKVNILLKRDAKQPSDSLEINKSPNSEDQNKNIEQNKNEQTAQPEVQGQENATEPKQQQPTEQEQQKL